MMLPSPRAALRGLFLVVLPGVLTGALLACLVFDDAAAVLALDLPRLAGRLIAMLGDAGEGLQLLVAKLALARGAMPAQGPAMILPAAGLGLAGIVLLLVLRRRRRRSAELVERLHRLYG